MLIIYTEMSKDLLCINVNRWFMFGAVRLRHGVYFTCPLVLLGNKLQAIASCHVHFSGAVETDNSDHDEFHEILWLKWEIQMGNLCNGMFYHCTIIFAVGVHVF